MDPKNIQIGKIGEELACSFLVKRGFKIIERNYLKKWGEIDIVAKKGKNLRFVEVKAVSCVTVSRETKIDDFRPEENVHYHKLKRLSRAIQTYLAEKNVSPETSYQIDVVAMRIDPTAKTALVEFLENVSLD